jgi:uncharacterized protein (TIGR03435 family)
MKRMRIRSSKGFVLAVLAGFLACIGLAQTVAAPAFEVASVKYDPRKAGSWVRFLPGGRLDASSWLKQLIQIAWDMKDYQVIGGPAWLGDDWYAVEAKTSDPNPDEKQMKLMLRTLLTDRFQLHLRRETREFPTFNLVVAKGGSKLNPLAEGAKSACARDNSLICGMRTTASLAGYLTSIAGRPVFDKTGLTGTFDILVIFNPYAGRDNPPSTYYADQPDMTTALHDQLGLQLEPSKEAMPVLIVESVQRPSDN